MSECRPLRTVVKGKPAVTHMLGDFVPLRGSSAFLDSLRSNGLQSLEDDLACVEPLLNESRDSTGHRLRHNTHDLGDNQRLLDEVHSCFHKGFILRCRSSQHGDLEQEEVGDLLA